MASAQRKQSTASDSSEHSLPHMPAHSATDSAASAASSASTSTSTSISWTPVSKVVDGVRWYSADCRLQSKETVSELIGPKGAHIEETKVALMQRFKMKAKPFIMFHNGPDGKADGRFTVKSTNLELVERSVPYILSLEIRALKTKSERTATLHFEAGTDISPILGKKLSVLRAIAAFSGAKVEKKAHEDESQDIVISAPTKEAMEDAVGMVQDILDYAEDSANEVEEDDRRGISVKKFLEMVYRRHFAMVPCQKKVAPQLFGCETLKEVVETVRKEFHYDVQLWFHSPETPTPEHPAAWHIRGLNDFVVKKAEDLLDEEVSEVREKMAAAREAFKEAEKAARLAEFARGEKTIYHDTTRKVPGFVPGAARSTKPLPLSSSRAAGGHEAEETVDAETWEELGGGAKISRARRPKETPKERAARIRKEKEALRAEEDYEDVSTVCTEETSQQSTDGEDDSSAAAGGGGAESSFPGLAETTSPADGEGGARPAAGGAGAWSSTSSSVRVPPSRPLAVPATEKKGTRTGAARPVEKTINPEELEDFVL